MVLCIFCLSRFSRKKKASQEVWFGPTPEKLPNTKLAPLVPDVFTSYTGPDKGLVIAHNLENARLQQEGNHSNTMIIEVCTVLK